MMRFSLGIFSLLLCFTILLSSCAKSDAEVLKESTVAVEKDSYMFFASQELKDDVKEIATYTTKDAAVAAVEEKTAQFVVLDEHSLENHVKNEKKIEKVKELQYKTEFYIYFYENQKLKQDFDKVIFDLLESGEIEKIKNKHIYSEEYELPLVPLKENAKTLVMATDIPGLPYSDLNDEGFIVGIDVDIAMLIANRLGCNLEILITDFDKEFMLLKDSEADFAISGLLYNEERVKEYDCSISYLSEKYYLAKRK